MVDFKIAGRKFELVDTAGMRRRPRVQDKLEKLSVADALNSIRYAEVVVLLVDVSGSMSGYADALLRLAHRLSQAPGARVETFTSAPG